jgi:LDH2 family malate/lactate/ureidoglycolate dehydrogenase
MTTLVPVKQIESFALAAYLELGVARADAEKAARLLVESDLVGQDGHGIFRLPQYAGSIRSGRIAANPNIRLVEDGPATALIDGDNGLGHLVMARATDVAIEKARTQGAAWVGVRGSNHAGAASIWASRMLPHDMIGIYLAVGSNNFMAPWGGFERLLGTNPLAFAVPALEEPPIVLDMATSIAANGKVQMARQRGEPIPAGWIIDRQGNPITDSNKAGEGALLPFGEYKGYGLALMIALLAGSLNEAAVGKAADTKTGPTNTGQSVLAVSISRFGDPVAFKRRVDAFAREIRSSGRLPGVDALRLPGERSHNTRLERSKAGVPIPPALRSALDKLADEIGIARLG